MFSLLIIRMNVSPDWFVYRYLDVKCQYAALKETHFNVLQCIFLLDIFFKLKAKSTMFSKHQK